MFYVTQDVLAQVLSIKSTTPERLSTHELAIANRICHCTVCNWLWVRRKSTFPERCPSCHSRAWDRPLISAMMAAAKNIPEQERRQERNKSEKEGE
jgi:predicted Zn-ribbon and HTH transcriptional regulator